MKRLELKSTPHQKFYLLIAGNLVILGLIGYFVLRPIFGMLMQQTSQITQVKQETATLQQKTVELQQLKQTYPTYESAYQPILSQQPKTKDTGGYQTELEDLAALTNVQLTLVDTSSSTAGAAGGQSQAAPTSLGGFPSFSAKVDLTGTFASVLDFVSRVETMNRFTRVTGMDLKSDQTGTVKATLDLQSIYFPN